MTIQDCIVAFERLVDEAFTPRPGQSMHAIRHLEKYIKRSKYQTGPLEQALVDVFTPARPLFRQWQQESVRPLNVAVTAASGTAGQGYILSNYNTQTSSKISRCRRYRPENPVDELRVAEA